MICLSYPPAVEQQNRLEALWRSLERWDTDLAHHGARTAEIGVQLARAFRETEKYETLFEWAARLHDIGKVGTPRAILDKPGPLTTAERAIIRAHPGQSFAILRHAGASADCLQMVLLHHEQMNSQGYPLGLKGEDIPLVCRILTVADVYSALASDRPYRQKYGPDEALALMKGKIKTAFDPRVLDALEQFTRSIPCSNL